MGKTLLTCKMNLMAYFCLCAYRRCDVVRCLGWLSSDSDCIIELVLAVWAMDNGRAKQEKISEICDR